jgi:hypothetical protein
MSVACAAEVFGRFLCERDTSNKPFEWTGRNLLSASPPQSPCLPLKGSVSRVPVIDAEPGSWGRPLCPVLLLRWREWLVGHEFHIGVRARG